MPRRSAEYTPGNVGQEYDFRNLLVLFWYPCGIVRISHASAPSFTWDPLGHRPRLAQRVSDWPYARHRSVRCRDAGSGHEFVDPRDGTTGGDRLEHRLQIDVRLEVVHLRGLDQRGDPPPGHGAFSWRANNAYSLVSPSGLTLSSTAFVPFRPARRRRPYTSFPVAGDVDQRIADPDSGRGGSPAAGGAPCWDESTRGTVRAWRSASRRSGAASPLSASDGLTP